jgi:hypothetical protein
MNKKIFLLTTFLTALSMTSFSQTIKDNIDKAAKNPSTKENAAKADVHLHNKTTIIDSSFLKNFSQTSVLDKKKKKKNCKKYK